MCPSFIPETDIPSFKDFRYRKRWNRYLYGGCGLWWKCPKKGGHALGKRNDEVLQADVDILQELYGISPKEIESAGNIEWVMIEKTALLNLEIWFMLKNWFSLNISYKLNLNFELYFDYKLNKPIRIKTNFTN